jgi:hypothetical protein
MFGEADKDVRRSFRNAWTVTALSAALLKILLENKSPHKFLEFLTTRSTV